MQCKSFGHGFALVRLSSIAEATTVKNSLTGQKPIGCIKPLKITFAVSEKKDDWYCPRCGDLQFQKNKQCRMCGCPRPKAGDVPQGTLPGAGDTVDGAAPSPFQSGAVPANDGSLPVFGKVAKGKGNGFKGEKPYGNKGKG